MYEYKAKVIKVIDGDTADVDIELGFDIVLKKQRIRFMGIDTPESRTSDDVEKIYGNMSKDFVKSFLKVGEYVTLKTFKDDRGKFGRILGDFSVYDAEKDRYVDLTKLMIEKHLAVPYHGQSKDDIEEQHLKNRVILTETSEM
jgi:micrococcal nuclease